MTPEQARRELRHMIETVIGGGPVDGQTAKDVMDTVRGDVPLLMQAIGAERNEERVVRKVWGPGDTYQTVGDTQIGMMGGVKDGDKYERWVTAWREVSR